MPTEDAPTRSAGGVRGYRQGNWECHRTGKSKTSVPNTATTLGAIEGACLSAIEQSCPHQARPYRRVHSPVNVRDGPIVSLYRGAARFGRAFGRGGASPRVR